MWILWKPFARNKIKRSARSSSPITASDIKSSSVVLFSVFTSYGDSIISFKVINEFIAANPKKRYIVLTTNQALPYAKKIIKKGIEFYGINKRKEPLEFFKTICLLKGARIDLGFNPWSYGEESKYFLTFAKKFIFYDKFADFSKEHNYYDRVREYLSLKPVDVRTKELKSGKVRHIVISPFSTETVRNLSVDDLTALVGQVKKHFPDSKITLALMKNRIRDVKADTDKFILRKDAESSEEFIRLLTAADLFISVDSGPLHLADALGVSSIGIFGPTAPESVLDKDSRVLPVRHKSLDGACCFIRDCPDPACIHGIFEEDFLSNSAKISFSRKVALETNCCLFKA